jgi:soluble lytic murein transglycosylase-like protein
MDEHLLQSRDGLGLRTSGDRRHDERRSNGGRRRDRRHRSRRRKSFRTFLFTAAALSASTSHGVKASSPGPAPVRAALNPQVTTSIDEFRAVSAQRAYEPFIREAALRYHLDPALIRAVIQTESGFDTTAVSPVGALGLMQIMPDLAEELGLEDPFDPRQNIIAGSSYLRRLLTSHAGNLPLALASYNAGPRQVARYRAIPPFKETRDYVKRVTHLIDAADSTN